MMLPMLPFRKFIRKRGLIPPLLVAALLLASPEVYGITVMEVTRDLACPCECPLVLEDCNMSCGLRWKDEIGGKINEGMNKAEIVEYFVEKYGEQARLTTLQRIHGKIYQYTRGFDTTEWVLLGSGTAIWTVLLFGGLYMAVGRKSRRRRNRGAATPI